MVRLIPKQARHQEYLKGKTIFILSQESWGVMRISKHHYARVLAEMGCRVYYFEPPILGQRPMVKVRETPEGVRVVSYRPLARGRKFVGETLFHWVQRLQIRQWILPMTGKPDIVWCFDSSTYSDLDDFRAALKIFHPVDHNLSHRAPSVARHCDFVFSTSDAILEYMRLPGRQGRVVPHGLSVDFERYGDARRRTLLTDAEVRPFSGVVGFWGSLFKEPLDRVHVLRIVRSFPDFRFIFWGAHRLSESNLAGKDDRESHAFIDDLRQCPNVELRGVRSAAEFIREQEGVDFFLNIEFPCSPRWDNGNPHKILEYLSTGKPVFSTPVKMYEGTGLLFESGTDDIVAGLKRFLGEWDHWASTSERLRRIEFALDNTYTRQLERIASFMAASRASDGQATEA